MPPLSSKPARRKTIMPIRQKNPDDVWAEALEALGYEALNTPSKAATSPIASQWTAPGTTPTSGPSRQHIEDLPFDILKAIFRHSCFPDLLSLSLVSKLFRDVAASHLYRTFDIVFVDEEDVPDDTRDALARGLDTFVTSDYDYAKHLRQIALGTVKGGEARERTYRHYLHEVSCGKFMNTLLLLTLRKATSLETFKWDIRVELSRPIFKALHGIQALRHLHLRMQAGSSVQQPLPPMSASTTTSSVSTNYIQTNHGNPQAAEHSTSSFATTKLLNTMKSRGSNSSLAVPLMKRTPSNPTLSGFKNLITLSIVDMDTLDFVDELNTCVRSCFLTLKSLKLSFSEALARKSRKPPPDPKSDEESDQEDEFGQLTEPGPGIFLPKHLTGASDPNGPIRASKAAEEKKRQEAVLGRIFGNYSKVPKSKKITSEVQLLDNADEIASSAVEDAIRMLFRNLAPIAAKLVGHINLSKDLSHDALETLAIIASAAESYLASKKGDKRSLPTSALRSIFKEDPEHNAAASDEPGTSAIIISNTNESGISDNHHTKVQTVASVPGVSNPEDIDIEAPEDDEVCMDALSEMMNEPTHVVEQEKTESVSSTTRERRVREFDLFNRIIDAKASPEEVVKAGDRLTARISELIAKLSVGKLTPEELEELKEVEGDFSSRRGTSLLSEAERQMLGLSGGSRQTQTHTDGLVQPVEEEAVSMSDYVRSTHGLALETLAIYLIPIKASVLSRTLDLSVLQSITLLNVGSQNPFWDLLAKENRLSPLSLCRIHTDHVTLRFLAFAGQLDVIKELYLVERDPKLARVESNAGKTNVNIDHFRRIVLKKHASNLKVLLLRNNVTTNWDMNQKTVLLLCQRAKLLEELAASFGMTTIHTLMQHLPTLVSLRVLHAVRVRFDDQCPFLPIQFRKFVVDLVSVCPGMSLEYIATENSVNRIARRKPKRNTDPKGKDKSTEMSDAASKFLANLMSGSAASAVDPSPTSAESYFTDTGSNSSFEGGLGLGDMADSSGDDEEDGEGSGQMLNDIVAIEGIRFSDVYDVRIWQREVIHGRL